MHQSMTINAAVDSVKGVLELCISIYWRNMGSIGGWFAVKTSFVVSFVWRASSSVMDKLKKIDNAISENDFKKFDKLKDCLQKQLQEARSRDKPTDLISLLAHALSRVISFNQRNFSHTKVRWKQRLCCM